MSCVPCLSLPSQLIPFQSWRERGVPHPIPPCAPSGRLAHLEDLRRIRRAGCASVPITLPPPPPYHRPPPYGQAITHTLVSNPAVPAKMEFKYAQASGDANSACFWESEGTKDVILAAGGTFRNLTNNAGASRTPEHCDLSHDGSTTVFSQKDSDGVYRVYRYDASTDASADISNPASTKAAWPRTSSNGDRTVFVSEQIVHDPRRTLSTRDVRVKDACESTHSNLRPTLLCTFG